MEPSQSNEDGLYEPIEYTNSKDTGAIESDNDILQIKYSPTSSTHTIILDVEEENLPEGQAATTLILLPMPSGSSTDEDKGKKTNEDIQQGLFGTPEPGSNHQFQL